MVEQRMMLVTRATQVTRETLEIQETQGDTGDTGNTGNTGNTGESCETEGDTRIISCGFNDNGDQEQICTDGIWKDQGDCVDSDECKNREVRNCVDFESFERCVDGSWKTISLKHKGLEWSCETSGCALWSSYPTIQELRTLVQNCPEVEYPKPDGVDYWCEKEVACVGCGPDKSVEYSVFLDTEKLMSSTVAEMLLSFPHGNALICLNFSNAGMDVCYETENYNTRCVRQ
jgi:hypothetical protein